MKPLVVVGLFAVAIACQRGGQTVSATSPGARVRQRPTLSVAVRVGRRAPAPKFDPRSRNPALAAPTVDPALDNLRFADRFPGQDAGAKIAAAIADLPASGGVVDARGFSGAQAISAVVTISKPLTLLLPAASDAEFVSTPDPAFDVHDASGVRIAGGRLTLSARNASAVTYTGTTSNLVIENMVVSGSGAAEDGQRGFHCASGQTLSDIRIVGNAISNVTLGISLNADLGGRIDGALVQGNRLSTIVGTAVGQGYGIHHANGSGTPSMIWIVDNSIELAQRHSIYQARGSGVVIARNLVVNHRQAVASGEERPAISVLRSTAVTVKNNVIEGPYDGAIDVNGDASGSESGVTIANNVVRNWHGFPALAIGSQAPQLEGSPTDVVVSANQFTNDQSATGVSGIQGAALLIWNGKRLTISDNDFGMLNSSVDIDLIAVEGLGESPGTAVYTDQVSFLANCCHSDGGPGTVTCGRVDAPASSAGSQIDFTGNAAAAGVCPI
jgi:Right handed beta helix region